LLNLAEPNQKTESGPEVFLISSILWPTTI